MNTPYFIEVLARNGEVKSRHRFDQLPIRIGRSYDNDLILDDPYIAAQHASVELTESGSLSLRDLSTQNGIVQNGQRESIIALDDNIVRLGHTNLRIRNAAFRVEKELADKTSYGWEGWPPALAGIIMIALSSLISVWIANTEKFSTISYLLATALIFTIVIVWCGCWAFANRVIGGHTRFGRHLFIVACAIVFSDLWEHISSIFSYAFSWEFLSLYSSHIIMVIGAGMVFFHLITVNNQHPKRFFKLCLALTLLGSGIILMLNYQRSGKFSDELYMAQILPPALHLSSDKPVAQFIQVAQSLKEQLDKERLEPANNGGLLGNSDF
jgi:pSer/pThr/pTyr-binding forkhead associated (FHA) protein